jgi:CRP-like cAMP-binding protein/membrane protease YdiL (CAAX protease family)
MAEVVNTLASAVSPRLSARLKGKHFEIPKNPLFANLTRQQVRLVLPHIKQRRFKPGRPILQEGARNHGKIYIVLDGQVSLAKDGISAVDARPMRYELSVLKRGEIFGEVSFVDGKPSSVSFVAKTEVTVAVVDLAASPGRPVTGRIRTIVMGQLRRHIVKQANESIALRMNSLQIENEFATYRSGVGHIVVTTLCLLSFYTLALSFLPGFKSVAHANFALTPLIIVLFALTFIPIIATSGFPLRFFGLQMDNWRWALSVSLQASALFLAAYICVKWLLINTTPAFAGLPLFAHAEVEVDGRPTVLSSWYWLALGVYLLLTPMQEFVARSGIQAPLYAFLHGSETKKRWWSIVASNLVFSAAHAHISLPFALAAFVPGLLWGWVFAKTNSLFATTVSHLIVGSGAIFVFGIEGVISRIAAL